jgi:hypothetical protein
MLVAETKNRKQKNDIFVLLSSHIYLFSPLETSFKHFHEIPYSFFWVCCCWLFRLLFQEKKVFPFQVLSLLKHILLPGIKIKERKGICCACESVCG